MKLLVFITIILSLPLWADDRTGFAKLKQSDYAAASLAFDDPFWIGVALYRERDWENAAANFALSDHPLAHYNLANCYAQMGYFALALETYEEVVPDSPVSADATFNAQLMKQLLAEESDDQQKPERSEPAESEDNQQQASQEQSSQSPAESASVDETAPSSDAADADASESSEGGSDQGQNQEQNRNEQVPPSEPEEEPNSLAADASDIEAQHDSLLFGDAEAMTEQQLQDQTIEQWLSTVRDEPARYLRARIEQTIRQRKLNGSLPPPEATAW